MFLMEMMGQLGYDAGTIGVPETRFGGEMLRSILAEPSVPMVSANLFDEQAGKPLLPPWVIVDREGMRVGITAVTGEEPGPFQEIGIRPEDPVESLRRVLPRLRAGSDVLVLIARLGLAESKDLVQQLAEQVDIVIVAGGRHERGVVFPETGGAVYLVTGTRGQSLARAQLALGKSGMRPNVVGDDIVLNRTVQEDPGTRGMVEEFTSNLNATMARDVVASAAERVSPDGHYYLGAENCRECHPREFSIWKETPHSAAFATLVDADAEALPECFQCHVTGNAQDAGYDPRVKTAQDLVNVQCEACHEQGSRHARDGSYGASRESCVRCHNPENSPDFDPEIYWLMIEH
jgi:Cytochrome c554 and c-prime